MQTPPPAQTNGYGSHPRTAPMSGGIATADKPVVRVELKPYHPAHAGDDHEAMPAREATTARTREAAPSSFWAEASAGRVLRVPTILAYVIGIGVALAVLATWFAAYRVGFDSGKDHMALFDRANAPPVVEPGARSGTNPHASAGAPSITPLPAPVPASAGGPPASAQGGLAPVLTVDELIAAARPGGTMAARGWITGDPRKNGEYYLELVTLSRQDAAKTLVFLAGRSQDAFALPVDSGTSTGNNAGPKFRLFVWPGLTQADYDGGTAKARAERDIAALGRVWSRDMKGPTDFRMPLWRKKT